MKRLRIIIRRILRQNLNTSVILISLAIGFSCINLIALFISRELKTDSFQKDKNQIYALTCDDPWNPGGKMYHCRFGSAEYMKDNFNQVEDYCRINYVPTQKIIASNQAYFDQSKIIAASKNFFEFFSYDLLYANPENVLETPDNLVISEDLAKKYFGDLSPIGQIITLVGRGKEEQMVVKGVFKKPIENTQIHFDMVRTIGEQDSRCYVKLAKNTDSHELEYLFYENRNSIPVIHDGQPGSYYLESLQDAYFDTTRRSGFEASRDKTDLWIALVIGLLILFVASINYLGLLNNNLSEKKKEYAIRKINGGSKYHIIVDYMQECALIIAVSLAFSCLILIWTLPYFNQLMEVNLTTKYILQYTQIFIFLGIDFILLLISWIFIIRHVHTGIRIQVLKNSKEMGRSYQFQTFNIFQLAFSIALIASSIIILKQIHFITSKPIGMIKEVLEVKIPPQYADQASVFKDKIKASAAIDQVSVANASPVLEHFLVLLNYEDAGKQKQYSPAGFTGDEHFVRTLGIKLLEGQDFSENPNVNKNKCLINQTLANLFPDRDLIGQVLPGMEDQIVIGIVQDFHYSSLKSMVEPAFISYADNGRHLMVRASENQLAEAKTAISNTWSQLIPNYPLEMETIGERYEWLHRENISYARLIGTCCLISIFLSMIGLFANSYHNSQRRVKEIGIRKVNGAKIWEVLTLLNKILLKWMTIAFLIATPIAWFTMHNWLENFAYKTEMNWWVFAMAGILALGITLITVSWQSWRAATRNPVEALRYE